MYNYYFVDKTVLVTGAGSGIGKGLCIALAAAGAIVFCTDLDPAKADETAVLIRAGAKAIAGKLDVTKSAEVEETIAGIVSTYGRIDIIFNNAGIAVSGEIRDIGVAEWEKIISVNFYGVLYCSQTAYAYMQKQGSGQIINIASAAGLIDYLVLMAPYSVTKHAVVNYTKLLRAEGKALGVKASVVCPGFISTSIATNGVYPNANAEWNNDAIQQVEKGISIDRAADLILKGVVSNREVIVFPGKVKVLVLFTRLLKRLHRGSVQKQMKNYREKFRMVLND